MADIQAIAADGRTIHKEVAGEEDGGTQALKRSHHPIVLILGVDRTQRDIGGAELNGRIGIGRIAGRVRAETWERLHARIRAGDLPAAWRGGSSFHG
jgi:hypothetical protein